MVQFLSVMLVIIFKLMATQGHKPVDDDYQIDVVNGSYSTDITVTVSANRECLIHFEDSISQLPYTVSAWSYQSDSDFPVFIMVRQQKEATSWEIPLLVKSRKEMLSFRKTSRTLCHTNINSIVQMPKNTMKINDHNSVQKYGFNKRLTMSVSTAFAVPTNVTVRVEEQDNFYLNENQNYSVTISPSEPRFFYYKFPDKSATDTGGTVLLQIESGDDTCLTVSIQNATCPVFDLNEDISYEGEYESVSTKGAIIITETDFPNGFFVVLVAKGDNFECDKKNTILPLLEMRNIKSSNHSSVVTFKITPSITKDKYLVISVSTLAGFLIFYVVFGVIYCEFCSSYKKRQLTFEEIYQQLNNDEGEEENDGIIQGDEIVVANNRVDEILLKPQLFLSDLARKDEKDIHRESVNYFLQIISIGLFYGIPVVQLIITNLRVLNITGNLDICYYNFLCAHPFSVFNDYNHVLSNIGYILLGILFVLITRSHKNMRPDDTCGIPKHYPLFYAMGTALMMEGLLSGCYHVCPSQSNFQFDTSFMYVMAVLCIIKLYQNRHPDINVTAYITFLILAGAVFMAMVGILFGHIVVWIIFIILYSLLTFIIAIQIYFINDWRGGFELVNRTRMREGLLQAMKPIKKDRYIAVVIVTILNIVMVNMGYLCYAAKVDFGTFLLGLLMANAVIYTAIYIVMKLLIHHEKLCIESILYLILAVILWSVAAYFFLHNSSKWTVTPAESRQSNKDCTIFHFYDYHDIWHLLSAPALFFSFMLLLTLDDDIIHKPRNEIVVF